MARTDNSVKQKKQIEIIDEIDYSQDADLCF